MILTFQKIEEFFLTKISWMVSSLVNFLQGVAVLSFVLVQSKKRYSLMVINVKAVSRFHRRRNEKKCILLYLRRLLERIYFLLFSLETVEALKSRRWKEWSWSEKGHWDFPLENRTETIWMDHVELLPSNFELLGNVQGGREVETAGWVEK